MSTISSDRLREMIDTAQSYIGANGYDPDPEEMIVVFTELLSLRESHPIEDGEGWIEWAGTDGDDDDDNDPAPPVAPDVTVEVLYWADGKVKASRAAAHTFIWRVNNKDLSASALERDGDIIAYRIIPSDPGTKVENSRST